MWAYICGRRAMHRRLSGKNKKEEGTSLCEIVNTHDGPGPGAMHRMGERPRSPFS